MLNKMPSRLLSALPAADLSGWLSTFDTVLTDCDGVLWSGERGIEGSAEAIRHFVRLGKRVFYVTNNSTKSREEYVRKCASLGFPTPDGEGNVFGTSYLAARYLKERGFDRKVYLVGSKGITQELDRVGIRHVGLGPDVMDQPLIPFITSLPPTLDREVGAVVVGFDEHISYPKMLKAASYLKDPSSIFLVTNTDERFPTDIDLVVPGTGTLVAAVQTASGRTPLVLGKPSPLMFQTIQAEYPGAVDPSRTLMIGDRAQSDVLLGKNCGLHTLLVLSGITTKEELDRWEASSSKEDKRLLPDSHLETLGDLNPALAKL